MNDGMRNEMAEATRLTRAGRLAEATALIQRTLGGVSSDATRSSPAAKLLPPRVAAHSSGPAGVAAEPVPPKPAPAGHSRGGRLARLSALIGPLRRGRGGPGPTPTPDQTPGEILAGGRFLDGSYASQAGARAYKLYVPSGYHGQASPLIVMLHGCTQSPDDFAAGTRMNQLAERDGFLVVYPAQAAQANRSKCWNWFKASDQSRDQGEPSLIAGITRQVMSTHQVDARRVYVAGLSAGGAMAMIMGVTYPDLYAAIGIHSGLAYGVAHDLASAFAAMRQGGKPGTRRGHARSAVPGAHSRVVPTIVFHGEDDKTVHPSNADQVLAHWATAPGASDPAPTSPPPATVHAGQAPGGHAYTRSVYQDAGGREVLERWLIHGAGHAWSGGSPHGSFTDSRGPDASQEMVRFFEQHSREAA